MCLKIELRKKQGVESVLALKSTLSKGNLQLGLPSGSLPAADAALWETGCHFRTGFSF